MDATWKTEIMVIGPGYWGCGLTLGQAIKRAPHTVGVDDMVYRVPAGATVDGMGRIAYDLPDGVEWGTTCSENLGTVADYSDPCTACDDGWTWSGPDDDVGRECSKCHGRTWLLRADVSATPR